LPDIVDAATRSRMMAGIRGRNTRPEISIRRALHALGFRYRIHKLDVPGKPDIVLPRYRAAVFVNGCFWHGHDCPLFRLPGTRRDFWQQKISRNIARDAEVRRQLDAEGWRHVTVWECAIRGPARLGLDETIRRLASWIPSRRSKLEIRAPRAKVAS
jgi:DNA mismatch endonuclease (patch repair protein)